MLLGVVTASLLTAFLASGCVMVPQNRRKHLADPLTIADLARHAGWAPRALARHFVEQTGMAPLRWLTAARIREARRLLEATDLPVEVITARCGLGTAANLRLHLARDAGATPTAYRASYQGHPPDAREAES